MNDPHVVSLTYRLTVGPSFKFNNPPALERELDLFSLRLVADTLVVAMKTHFATSDEARRVVDSVLRAWEIDTGLVHGPNTIAFSFHTAEVIDRSPLPGSAITYTDAVRGGIAIGGCVRDILVSSKYTEPPARFSASPEVELMWLRYTRFTEGKEPLLSMAYAVLTLLEATTGQKTGARAAVCTKYMIDRAVRDKLGNLVSERGSPKEARKLDYDATRQPLTDTEREWIVGVVKSLIRRKAEHDASPTVLLPLITLGDFPMI